MPDPVISVAGLRKSYGDLEAVRGMDLEVAAGEIFAFLGPNGAGKTTTVEILEGYRERSAGEVSVLGVDPARADRAWRQRVGFVLQECRLTPELTVNEAVAQYAGYYAAPRDVTETVELVGLSEKVGRAHRAASRAASSAASTWRWRWSATPSCSSSTSPRPGSTPPPAATPGR